MRASAQLRDAIRESPDANFITYGRLTVAHVSMRSTTLHDIEQAKIALSPALSNIEIIDPWHLDALKDIFSSEIVMQMRNNVGDYIWNELTPYKYSVPVLPPARGRTLEEINEYIQSFANSNSLLMHVIATEAVRHADARGDTHKHHFVLHEPGNSMPLSLRSVCDAMVAHVSEPSVTGRGDGDEMRDGDNNRDREHNRSGEHVRNSANSQDTNAYRLRSFHHIFDHSCTELLFAVRTAGRYRVSISATSDHSIALATPIVPNNDTLKRLDRARRRLTASGLVTPSWRENVSLGVTFVLSFIMLVAGVILNWANRDNLLERIFDGVGIFSVMSFAMLAVLSRRLDFFDFVALILRRKRYLSSYEDLLHVLRVSEAELKSALTFEGVHVPPLSPDDLSFAFEKHEGFINTHSGLDSTTDSNIIVGNKTAIARGTTTIRYFDVRRDGEGHVRLRPCEDARSRLVTDGDDKIVK